MTYFTVNINDLYFHPSGTEESSPTSSIVATTEISDICVEQLISSPEMVNAIITATSTSEDSNTEFAHLSTARDNAWKPMISEAGQYLEVK